ncbi:hypothetical protein Tco_0938782 [Tanacetum coccineum]|uniref:Uncharacterized protein n=1 Tax=Tanacetum coccineum TaxID=301880 RepID=A0ABQ5DJ07_9ASTR
MERREAGKGANLLSMKRYWSMMKGSSFKHSCFKKEEPSRSTPLAQSRSSGTPFPIAHYVNCDKFSYCHQTFLEAIEKEMHYEAIKDKSWRSAMDSELEALEQNKPSIAF